MGSAISRKDIRKNIPTLHHYLLILFAFSLPISTAANSIAAGLIILLWLIEGNFKDKFQKIIHHPLAIWSLLFVFAHLLGLLWTNDMKWGLHIVKKEAIFILLPIFLTVIKRDKIQYYVLAFIAAMIVSEIVSYLVWLGLFSSMASIAFEGYGTAFISHISYSPFLAFTIYLLLHQLFFEKPLDRKDAILSLFFILTMSFNLFISGGRAGQLGFFVIYALFVFQYYHKNIAKATMITLVTIPTIIAVLYTTNTAFQSRVDAGISDIATLETKSSETSIGKRITYFRNSIPVIQDNPFFGVGTGDFREAYTVVNSKNTPEATVPDQPHNMYILVLAQLGLLGFIPFVMLLYTQIKTSLSRTSSFYRIQLALPVLFMVIMLSDSYLLGHHTTMLFIFFSAILFLESQWNIKKS